MLCRFLILFILSNYDTRSTFSLNRIILYSQAFARSPTLAFSSVRENVNLNTKLEMCWKILLFIKLFYLILFLFYLILSDIIDVIVI